MEPNENIPSVKYFFESMANSENMNLYLYVGNIYYTVVVFDAEDARKNIANIEILKTDIDIDAGEELVRLTSKAAKIFDYLRANNPELFL